MVSNEHNVHFIFTPVNLQDFIYISSLKSTLDLVFSVP